MNAAMISNWIKSLGKTYHSLIAEGLIEGEFLQELYLGIDVRELDPCKGVSLSFWAETKRLESVFITLKKTTPSTVKYEGGLPEPYSVIMMQKDARMHFGEPLAVREPLKMPEPVGQTGGWESFPFDAAIHPNIKVVFQYDLNMQVNTLVFSLIDKGHE